MKAQYSSWFNLLCLLVKKELISNMLRFGYKCSSSCHHLRTLKINKTLFSQKMESSMKAKNKNNSSIILAVKCGMDDGVYFSKQHKAFALSHSKVCHLLQINLLRFLLMMVEKCFCVSVHISRLNLWIIVYFVDNFPIKHLHFSPHTK